MDNGTRVIVVVPFGANAGDVTARGVVVGKKTGGIDGTVYYVREADGTVNEHSDGWVRRA